MRNSGLPAVVFLAVFLAMGGVGRAEQHDRLVPLFVDLAGWQAQPAQGMSLLSAQMKMISANRNYSQSDKNLTVSILVNSGPVLDSDLQEFNSDNETLTIYSRQIDGFWVKSTHTKENRSGQVLIYLDYNQEATGLLIAEYAKMDEEEVMQVIKNMDLKKLKKVVSGML